MFKKSFTVTVIAIALGLATASAGAEQVTTDGPKPLLEAATNLPTTPLPAIDPATWALVRTAVGWLGVPYRAGGKSPERGFDCSGFVGAVFKKTFGLVLPPSALTISKIGQPITFEELKIGDLIFFNTLRRPFSHIGIYMGEGRFIHACSTANQIKIDSLDQYYKKRLNGFRRINLD